MKIGCPTEIKPQEFRVGMTPDAAREAVNNGHQVVIQQGAGLGAGFTDEDYTAAGAVILDTAEEIFATADMIGCHPRHRRGNLCHSRYDREGKGTPGN